LQNDFVFVTEKSGRSPGPIRPPVGNQGCLQLPTGYQILIYYNPAAADAGKYLIPDIPKRTPALSTVAVAGCSTNQPAGKDRRGKPPVRSANIQLEAADFQEVQNQKRDLLRGHTAQLLVASPE